MLNAFLVRGCCCLDFPELLNSANCKSKRGGLIRCFCLSLAGSLYCFDLRLQRAVCSLVFLLEFTSARLLLGKDRGLSTCHHMCLLELPCVTVFPS